MTTAILKISIRPDQLSSNLMDTISNIIENDYIGKCHPEYGYVNNVTDIIIHKNHGIEDRTCNNIFSIRCNMDCIIPVSGIVLKSCEVIMQHERGIFLSYKNLRILVPLSNLGDYRYDRLENVFIRKSNDIVVYIGDTFDIKITDVKYSNNIFNCIGMLN